MTTKARNSFLTLVLLAASIGTLAGCGSQMAAQTNDTITLARGATAMQTRLATLMDAHPVSAGPLTHASATAVATEVERILLNYEMRLYVGLDVDLSFREAFKKEIVDALTSNDAPTRTLMAAYLRSPHAPENLAAYSGDTSFEGVRRYAILAHPVAPSVATQAYDRAYAIRPDAFCMLQAADLYRSAGSGAIARNMVNVVRERWADDKRVQAIALVKDAFLDGDSGLYVERRQKLEAALALNLEIERLDGVASNLIDLADQDYPVRRDGDTLYGLPMEESAAHLRRAMEIAQQIGSDRLLERAASKLADIASFGSHLGGSARAAQIRQEALNASLRSGDYFRAAALAKQSADVALARDDLNAADNHIATLERIGFDLGDHSVVFEARLLSVESAIAARNYDRAEQILASSRLVGALAPLGAARLEYRTALLDIAREDVPSACEHFRTARREYGLAQHQEGVAFTDDRLRESCAAS